MKPHKLWKTLYLFNIAELKRELTVAREVISDNRKEMTILRNEVVELKRESARVKQQINLQEVYSRRDNLHKHY